MPKRRTGLFRELQVPRGRINSNIDEWIDKAFELNRAILEEKIQGIKAGPKAWFRDTVKAYIREDGMTPSEAVKYVGRSEAIRSKAERQLENAWRGLRKDQDAWRRFKRAAGISNLDQVEWDQLDYTRGDFGAFVYAGRVIIDLRNSPEEIIIRKI